LLRVIRNRKSGAPSRTNHRNRRNPFPPSLTRRRTRR